MQRRQIEAQLTEPLPNAPRPGRTVRGVLAANAAHSRQRCSRGTHCSASRNPAASTGGQ